MKRILSYLFLLVLFTNSISAQEIDSTEIITKQIEELLKFQTGIIKLPEGNGTLVIPKGFHYLDKEQSKYVLTDLWSNPEDATIIGMLFPLKKVS